MSYIGRFAPTPSGPLHFGSLVAALGSYLDAKANYGHWLLRIEDVDTPRVVAGASEAILCTLTAYGFVWDGVIVRQGERSAAYRAALERLIAAGRIYGCTCSRKAIGELAIEGIDGPVYPGTCRGRPPTEDSALRFHVDVQRLAFTDRLQGEFACDFGCDLGDFVVKRADGIFTYQLAVVVDDAEAGVTDIVRGADLIASTPRQIILQQALGLPAPRYLHLPVVLDLHGDKFSKQTLAAPLDDADPLPALRLAARFLGLGEIVSTDLAGFWDEAIAAWRVERLPAVRGMMLADR